MSHQLKVPRPVVINHMLLFWVGTGLWFTALLVMVALDLLGVYQARVWITVCAVGTLLGIAALFYVRFSWRARSK